MCPSEILIYHAFTITNLQPYKQINRRKCIGETAKHRTVHRDRQRQQRNPPQLSPQGPWNPSPQEYCSSSHPVNTDMGLNASWAVSGCPTSQFRGLQGVLHD